MKRLILVSILVAFSLPASTADQWVIFKDQINGPVAYPGGTDLETFRSKRFPGMFWSEAYYHHINLSDGSMITVQIGYNLSDASVIFVRGKPGTKAYSEYIMMDFDDVAFDKEGFGITVGSNRIWLKEDKYFVHVEFGKVKAQITYEILAGSYTYGDGMLRYPGVKYYAFYTLPIPWAKVKVEAEIDGKQYSLTGFGNMNHDAWVLSPYYAQSRWRVFWFFEEDHAVAVTNFNTHKEFDEKLVQRLVFVDKKGGMFTSTDFQMKWDDWVDVDDIPFRYPRHYVLSGEAGGAKLEVEVRAREVLLREDLYSNLPSVLAAIAKRITRNGWTYDCWCDYTLTYTHDGRTDTYKGAGITRWTNLEEE